MQPTMGGAPGNPVGRFLRSPMFPIFLTVFVDVLGAGIVLPVLPLYAQNIFAASASQITLLTSTYFGAQFLATPLLGRLSDRFGRRPVLIVSQLGTMLALLMSGAAGALWVLYVARTLDGLTGGNISVAQAYLADITDESNRARGLGLINAAFSSGFIFGPVFGALVAAQFGPRAPFLAAAMLGLVTVSLSLFMLPESLPKAVRERNRAAETSGTVRRMNITEVVRLPGMALIMLISFGAQFAFFGFQTTWVLWAEAILLPDLDYAAVQRTVGLILTVVGVAGVLTQAFLVGPLVKRYGERMLVATGNFLRVLVFGGMAGVPWLPVVALLVPFVSVSGGLILPSSVALGTYLTPKEHRGQAIGWLQSAQGLGRILGPILGGVLFERIAPGAPLWAASAISLVTFFVSLLLWRLPVRKPAPAV